MAYFYFHWASRIFALHFQRKEKKTPPSLSTTFYIFLFRCLLRASAIGPCDAPAVSQLASRVVEDLSRFPQWHGAALQTHHHKNEAAMEICGPPPLHMAFFPPRRKVQALTYLALRFTGSGGIGGGSAGRPWARPRTAGPDAVGPGVGPTKEAASCRILLLNRAIDATTGKQ